MTLVVELGTGRADADSYASLTQASDYSAAQGLAWSGGDAAKEAALRRATLWVDTTYRGRFPGVRRNRRLQALEWPRVGAALKSSDPAGVLAAGAWDGSGVAYPYANADVLPYDQVPREIVNATIEAAVRQLADATALLPDASVVSQAGAGPIKRETAGDHSVEYFPGASSSTSTSGGSRAAFPIIDALLAGILIAQSGFTARAARA